MIGHGEDMAYFWEELNNDTFYDHIARTVDAMLEANVKQEKVFEVVGKFWPVTREEFWHVFETVKVVRQQREEQGIEL